MWRVFTLFFCFFSSLLIAQSINPSVVQKKVQDLVIDSPETYHPIYVLLEDQINLQQLEQQLRLQKASLEERTATLIPLLKEKAASTQLKYIQEFEQSTAVETNSIHSFWIANAVFLKAKKSLIEKLSNDPYIAWIGYDANLELTEAITEAENLPIEPNSIEPGLLAVNAPALWEKGYTGYGQMGFVADTGVDPHHPSIANQYAGFHSTNQYEAWYDFNQSTDLPEDCGDHGTHVLGTMMGLDRLNKDTIGVAYNARWVGGAILCGLGTADNIGAFEWSLDPDQNPTTIEDMPDVINNSWYDPTLQGEDCTSIYVPTLEALEVAGIAVIFSAGNEGPDDGTITQPHNINRDTVDAFTVAATRVFSPYLVADFSSRGPSHCGGEGTLLIKPEVAAPGVNVRSAVFNGEYGQKSGTSMAAPHVSGVIMLLKEAFPYLTGRELKLAVFHTCTDLGDEGEDNVYGMGMINALEAYNYLIAKGYEPVPPVNTNDVILISSSVQAVECGNEVSPFVMVENAGVNPIYSLDFTYLLDGDLVSLYTWNGYLAPHDRTFISLPIQELESGNFLMAIDIQKVNGLPDYRPLNNRIQQPIIISSAIGYNASVMGESEVKVCKNANAVLYCDYVGDAVVEWYDAINNGNKVGEGFQFTTDPLDTTTTFFADVLRNGQAGLSDQSEGTPTLEEDNTVLMKFESIYPFTLKSVKVFYDNPGGRIIQLLDNAGEVVSEKTLILAGSGEKVVDLNLKIEPGEYQFKLHQGNALSYSVGEFDYPFVVNDVLTINAASNQAGIQTYGPFYDWQIEFYDVCGRVPVLVEVLPADSIPQAEFVVSSDTINLDFGEMFVFSDSSMDASSWYWDFGDGNSSTEQNPSHTYAIPGTYYVSLSVENNIGCTDVAGMTLEATSDLIENTNDIEGNLLFKLYPNPFTEHFKILYTGQSIINIQASIVNFKGQMIRSFPEKYIRPFEEWEIPAHDLSSGVYFLQLQINETRFVKKLIRL